MATVFTIKRPPKRTQARPQVLLIQGNARHIPLQDASVHCTVCSPPYFALRSYGIGTENGEIGLETRHDCLAWVRQEPPCAQCWVCSMRTVFAEVHRVMRPDGTLWCNVGDSYASSATGQRGETHTPDYGDGVYHRRFTRMMGAEATADFLTSRRPPPGLPAKNLLGLPWRLALALQADGFILRSEIILHKLNPMPESVRDRPTRSHEQIFLFSKQGKYYYDAEAVKEPAEYGSGTGGTRAMRNVWSLSSEPTPYAHFATFSTALVRKCLMAGAPLKVCNVCSTPWVRQVEQSGGTIVASWHNHRDDLRVGQRGGNPDEPQRTSQAWRNGTYRSITTGWAPTCSCNTITRRSVVLDPFAGSGTVGLVARELGHDAVCADLSWEYLQSIARKRLVGSL